MWEAMSNKTVKYAPSGRALIPGDEGYDQGLPEKFNSVGMPVLPGDPEYDDASPIQPDENTQIIEGKFVEQKQKKSIFSKLFGKKH